MPVYLFSALAAPKAIMREIRNMQQIFLWSGANEQRKWDLVSWETLRTPKNQGGLNLCDPEKVDYVSGAKLWWIWVTYNQEPWVRVWNKKYVAEWEKENLI